MKEPIIKIAYIFLSLTCFFGAETLAQPSIPRQLFVEIVKDGNFEVLLSRSKSGTASAVFFGLIGGGIESASRASSDTQREKRVAGELAETSCRTRFESALTEHLRNNNTVIVDRETLGITRLSVEIVACGFKVMNRENEGLSAYFEATYHLTLSNEKKTKKPKRLLVVGKNRSQWIEYEQSGELAAQEFQQVLDKAGRKLANKVIYLKEG